MLTDCLKIPGWTHALTWYFIDAKGSGFKPVGYRSGAAAGDEDLKKKEADLKAREAALRKKEEAVAAIDQREQDLNKKAQDLEAKEAEQEVQAKQLDDEKKQMAKKKTAPLTNGYSSDSDHQADLDRKLEEMKAKERDIASREARLKSNQDNVQQSLRDMKSAKAKNEELQKSVAQLEQELEEAKKAAQQSKIGTGVDAEELERLKEESERLKNGPACTDPRHDAQQAEKLKKENERLKDLIADQALQLNEARKNQANHGQHRSNGRPSPDLSNSKAAQSDHTSPMRYNVVEEGPPPRPRPAKLNSGRPKPAVSFEDSELAKLKAENAQLQKDLDNMQHRPVSGGRQTSGPIALATSPAQSGSQRPLKVGTRPGSSNAASSAPVKGKLPGASIPSDLTSTSKPPPELLKANSSRPLNNTWPTTSVNETGAKRPPPRASSHLAELQPENERLQKQREQLADKQKKLAEMNSASKGPKPAFQDIDDGLIEYSCGHKLYVPPRKVERRVVGIMYEN